MTHMHPREVSGSWGAKERIEMQWNIPVSHQVKNGAVGAAKETAVATAELASGSELSCRSRVK